MPKVRVPAFDILKFLAILCVVAGHCEGNVVQHSSFLQPCLGNAIVGVSMPMFFIISGYFSVRVIEGDWSKLMARVIGLLWPLFSFGLVFALVLFVAGDFTPVKAVLFPFARIVGGWFLRTMAIVYLLVFLVCHLTRRALWRMVLLLLIYLGMAVVPRTSLWHAGEPLWFRASTFWIGEAFHMFPYFCFGAFVLRKYDLWRQKAFSLVCGLFFLGVVLLEGDVTKNGMGFYWVSTRPAEMFGSLPGLVCFFGRTAVGIAGTVFLLRIFEWLAKRFSWIGGLSFLGRTTLGVYVMHEWPLAEIGRRGIFETLLPSWSLWPLALCVFLFLHCLTVLIKKSSALNVFFFGDEKWMDGLLCGCKRGASIKK